MSLFGAPQKLVFKLLISGLAIVVLAPVTPVPGLASANETSSNRSSSGVDTASDTRSPKVGVAPGIDAPRRTAAAATTSVGIADSITPESATAPSGTPDVGTAEASDAPADVSAAEPVGPAVSDGAAVGSTSKRSTSSTVTPSGARFTPLVYDLGTDDSSANGTDSSSGAEAGTAKYGIGPYDDKSSAISYSGSWRRMSSASDLGGSSNYLNSTGKAEFRFTGDAIEWYSRTSATSGINDVYIDGKKVASVDRYTSGNQFAVKVFEKRGLGSGSHVIAVTWTGKKNAKSGGTNLLIDGFRVVDTAASSAPSGVTGKAYRSGVLVQWTKVTGATIAGYRVYRAPSSGGSFAKIGETSGSRVQFHDAGRPASSTSRYRVTSVNAAGNESTPSNIATLKAEGEPAAAHRYTDCPAATTKVSNAEGLRNALASARPGTTIRLAAGTYAGQFKINRSGTESAPIWICGTRSAVIDGGQINDLHGLFIDTVHDVNVSGFTVQNALKGITVKTGKRVTVSDMLVQNVGYEGVHLKQFTTDSDVVGNTIKYTGKLVKKYGEGIYIGSSEGNWCDLTSCKPDRTDRIRVIGNSIQRTGAQSIEAKEGTSDGLIHGNTVDDSANFSPESSWVLVKGNGWVVAHNVGKGGNHDGFSTNASVSTWGENNVFVNNVAQLGSKSTGYWIHRSASRGSLGNIVSCGNQVTGSGSTLTNVDCQP